MPLDQRMDKEDVVLLHNGALYSRKNDIIKFVDKRMDLQNIMLSEVTQTQKDKYNMYLLISGFSDTAKRNHPIIHSPRKI